MTVSSTASQSPLVLESSGACSPSPVIPWWARPLRGWWAQAWRDVGADLKDASWGRGSILVLSLLLTVGPFTCLMYFAPDRPFPTAPYDTGSPGIVGVSCLPDGSFSSGNRKFQYWQISGFFQITLPFWQQLTFTDAKVIDIIWDLAVGKGGQAILAFYSWKAFSIYVRSAMHSGPVTYSSFFAIFLESEASLRSVYRITRDFTTRRALRSTLAMMCIIAVMVFVLAWPTLAGAMTGYTPAIRPFVLDIEDNLISDSGFKPVAYVIHDGWRVNLTGNYLISFDFHQNAHINAENGWEVIPIEESDDDNCSGIKDAAGCYFLAGVSAYTRLYGFLALNAAGDLNDIETSWMNRPIEKPALNISAFYIPPEEDYWGDTWVDPRSNLTPYNNYDNRVFMTPLGNTTYNSTYLEQRGRCQAIDNRYQWGFSFLQLFIVTMFLVLWVLAVYIMWLKGHLDLQQRNGDEAPDRFKAVLDLAAALDHEFATVGEVPDRLTNRQLNNCISKQLNRGKIAVRMPLSTATGYSFRKGAWIWIKKEKWWLPLVIVPLLVSGMSPWLIPLAFFGIFAFSVMLALAIGRTTASRVLISLAGLILSVSLIVGISPVLPIRYLRGRPF